MAERAWHISVVWINLCLRSSVKQRGSVDMCGCRRHAQTGSLHHRSQGQQHAASVTVYSQPDVQSRDGENRWHEKDWDCHHQAALFWVLARAICRLPWYCNTGCLAIPALQRNPIPSNYGGRDTLATSSYFWHGGMCIASASGEVSACCSSTPRVPMLIGWLRWALTCCFPQRHRLCGVFCAKVAWGKFAAHWPPLWMQRKLYAFGPHACFQLVKIHCPIKKMSLSAVFSPAWHAPAYANRSFTGITGTENA